MSTCPTTLARGDSGLPTYLAAHSDATIDALPLDAVGEVPWWPEGGRELTLHRALVHVIVDIHRHAATPTSFAS